MANLSQLFSDAVAQSEAERAEFLARIGKEDPQLRARLEALLVAHDDRGSFLERPLVTVEHDEPGQLSAPLEPGVMIGRYELIKLLGEGGFGAIYLAEQAEPIRRQVALKIIKLGMDTRQVIARFDAERQALALMDHPNIAKVFDAGATQTGRPYFVMELVRGEPITTYCDEHNMDVEGRLKLFQRVCQAVQHAHQKGVIHRDLKPTNVMVDDHGTRPMPKVIDFGIAKAIHGRLTDATLQTEHQQLVGTPAYMSPEQASTNGADIDTRSDVYSLGVLLYELLTGVTPFDSTTLRRSPHHEIQRVILQEVPPKPSTRLGTLQDSQAIAASRSSEPRKLASRIRGDVDWIVMKCLEKDRSDRYESAAALASDIQRQLRNEPVVAGPPGVSYRIGKFVRRNRRSVLAGCALLIVLLGGLVSTTIFAIGQARARANADQQAQLTSAVNAFMAEILTSAEPSRGGADVRVVDVLDAASVEADVRFADHPAQRGEVRLMLGHVYSRLDLPRKAIDEVEQARTIFTNEFGEEDPRTLRACAGMAIQLHNLGRREEADELARWVVATRQQVLGASHPETLRARVFLGRTIGPGDHKDALEDLRDVIQIAETKLGPTDLVTLEARRCELSILMGYGSSLHGHADATSLYEEVLQRGSSLLELHESIFAETAQEAQEVIRWLASANSALGRADETEILARRMLEAAEHRYGPGHFMTTAALDYLTSALLLQDRLEEAAEAAIRATEGERERNGDTSMASRVSMAKSVKKLTLAGGKRPAQGEAYARLLLARYDDSRIEHGTFPWEWSVSLAYFLAAQGRPAEAADILSPMLPQRDSIDSAASRVHLDLVNGVVLRELDQLKNAEKAMLSAWEIGTTDGWTWDARARAWVAREIIALYEALDQTDQAESWRALLDQ